jgi:hypothetical protein
MTAENSAATELQLGKWLRIAAYGDFFDIPRRILLLDREFVFWLFVCRFDDDLDDYEDAFSVWRIGHDARNAKSCFESSNPQRAPVERIPVARFEFDETRRQMLFVHAGLRPQPGPLRIDLPPHPTQPPRKTGDRAPAAGHRPGKETSMHLEDAAVIPLKKSKLIRIAVIAAVFVAIGIFLMFTGDVVALLIGMASVLFFGTILTFGIRKLFDRKPGLIVTSGYIEDNASGVAAGRIPWSEIRDVSITTMNAQPFLTIHVADPEKYVDRGGVLKRTMNRANLKYFGSPIHIPATTLDIDFDDLATLVEHRFRLHTSAQPGA